MAQILRLSKCAIITQVEKTITFLVLCELYFDSFLKEKLYNFSLYELVMYRSCS